MKVRIARKAKEERRAKRKVRMNGDLRARARNAVMLRDTEASEEEKRLISRMVKSPEGLRASSVNPMARRLRELQSGTSDTSHRASLFPEEALRESRREQIRTHTDKTGVLASKRLDDWHNAPSTKELTEAASLEVPHSSLTRRSATRKSLRVQVKRREGDEQDDQLSLAKSVQSLCLTLFKGAKDKDVKEGQFISRISQVLGPLFDSRECAPQEVPVIPQVLNLGSRALGGTFPSFGELGKDMSKLLADVLRNKLLTSKKAYKAVRGLRYVVKGGLTAEDCATWLVFFSFGLAFVDFCCLADDAAD